MAIAFIDRQPLSRTKGHNMIAKAAYNSCGKIGDQDYRKKRGLAHAQIITHDGKEPLDRAAFWHEVEAKEKRRDAQVGYSYTGALPIELTKEQQIKLAETYAKKILLRYNLEAADLTIHHPTKRRKSANEKKENPHFHLLTSTRTKDGKKLQLFGDVDDLLAVRQLWQDTVNEALKEAGHKTKIDVRSVEAQAADLDHEIATLEEKEKSIVSELTRTKKEIESHDRRAATPGNRNAIPPIYRLAGGADPQESGQHQRDQKRLEQTLHRPRRRIQRDRHQPRQAGGTSEQRGVASTSRDPQETGRSRGSHRHTFQYAAQAKRIAARIDGLRYKRTYHFINHRLTCLAANIATRLEALRYERTAAHYRNGIQNQQTQQADTPCR